VCSATLILLELHQGAKHRNLGVQAVPLETPVSPVVPFMSRRKLSRPQQQKPRKSCPIIALEYLFGQRAAIQHCTETLIDPWLACGQEYCISQLLPINMAIVACHDEHLEAKP
jgi:hypothetical protein